MRILILTLLVVVDGQKVPKGSLRHDKHTNDVQLVLEQKKEKNHLILKKTSRIGEFLDVDDNYCDINVHRQDCFDAESNDVDLSDYHFTENDAVEQALERAITFASINSCTSCGFSDDVSSLGPLDCVACKEDDVLIVLWDDCTGICTSEGGSLIFQAAGFATLEDSSCALNRLCYGDLSTEENSGENDFFLSVDTHSNDEFCNVHTRFYCNPETGTIFRTDCGDSDMCAMDNDDCLIGVDSGVSEFACGEFNNNQSVRCDGSALIVTDCEAERNSVDYGESGLCFYNSCDIIDDYDDNESMCPFNTSIFHFFCLQGDVYYGSNCREECTSCNNYRPVSTNDELSLYLSCENNGIDTAFSCDGNQLNYEQCDSGIVTTSENNNICSCFQEDLADEEDDLDEDMMEDDIKDCPQDSLEQWACNDGIVMYGSACSSCDMDDCSEVEPAVDQLFSSLFLSCATTPFEYVAYSCSEDDGNSLVMTWCATGVEISIESSSKLSCSCDEIKSCPTGNLEKFGCDADGNVIRGSQCSSCSIEDCQQSDDINDDFSLANISSCNTSIHAIAYTCDEFGVLTATVCDSNLTFSESSDGTDIGCSCGNDGESDEDDRDENDRDEEDQDEGDEDRDDEEDNDEERDDSEEGENDEDDEERDDSEEGDNDEDNEEEEDDAEDDEEVDEDEGEIEVVVSVVTSSFIVQGVSLAEAEESEDIFVQAIANVVNVDENQVTVFFSGGERRRLQDGGIIVDYSIDIEDTKANIELFAAQVEEVDKDAIEEAITEVVAGSDTPTVLSEIDVTSVDEVRIENDSTEGTSSGKKSKKKNDASLLLILIVILACLFLLAACLLLAICSGTSHEDTDFDSAPQRDHTSEIVEFELIPGKNIPFEELETEAPFSRQRQHREGPLPYAEIIHQHPTRV